MQLLKETPSVHSQSRWEGVKADLEYDPRYRAVPSDSQREDWFDEYIQNLVSCITLTMLNFFHLWNFPLSFLGVSR